MVENYINNYLNYIISKNYYVISIIEDLILYFDFNIIIDNVKNDIRFIELVNHKKDKIIIFSEIVSFYNEIYTQYNKLCYSEYINFFYYQEFNYKYFANCDRNKKNLHH